ncbi:MAG: hypothetical protein KME32_32200 [Mojavia pulchra JT2-VF2]|uniref:Uncharacterized protein n=1 Tax=Mojavia pulchra JT2-VF2 TaxID=287848 RepID=A0A951Q4I1_9NOST|nr:hypothetical protein [Mojavia pulchra JT2-VF2]
MPAAPPATATMPHPRPTRPQSQRREIDGENFSRDRPSSLIAPSPSSAF